MEKKKSNFGAGLLWYTLISIGIAVSIIGIGILAYKLYKS